SECQILVADHESNFALVRLAPHSSAETPKCTETARIADFCRRGVAVKDDRLILDQHTTLLVIAPNSFGQRKSSGSAKQLAKHFERRIHPVFLVYCRDPIALHARHKEDNQHSFAGDLQT